MFLIGDHQPPVLVSGAGASWDVPVDMIASRRGVLDRLRQHRFREGLVPRGPAVARMDALLPILLDGLGDEEHKLAVRHPVANVFRGPGRNGELGGP